MKLVVCGCSWSTRDRHYPDTEFGHFVAEHYGWDYVNLGIPGCSNPAIRLQIEHAVKVEKADFVIVNWTTACRDLINHSGKRFNFKNGLQNLDYEVDHLTNNKDWSPFGEDSHATVIAQSIPGLIYAEDPTASWETVLQFWPEGSHYFTEASFKAYRANFFHNYDSEVAAMNQYFIIQSAVHLLEKNNVKYVMAPNTFIWKQAFMELNNLDFNADMADVYMDEYTFDFIPKVNMLKPGIADALQWDLQHNPDSIEHPDHSHCHHLTTWAQKKWATEVAIPQINKVLSS